MRYTIDWRPNALRLLGEIWLNAADRQALTAASHQVDQLLAVAPDIKGEDFYGDRLLVVGPLHVVYQVDSAKRTVIVLHLWAV